MKITSLEMENVKAVKAVRLEPNSSGLTVIGGRNGQGKTSVLDAIAYALGGEKFRPTNLKRDGAVNDPYIHIETDDGLVVERKGKNSDLRITDSTGRKCGQALLNSVVGKLAIDLPSFINSSSQEKARILLGILGVQDKIEKLDADEKAKYNTRLLVGRQMDQKRKAADDMPYHQDAPDEPVSIADLVKEFNSLSEANARARRMIQEREAIERKIDDLEGVIERTRLEIEELKCKSADISLENPVERPTDEIEARINEAEEVNQRVAENSAKLSRIAEADDLKEQYDSLTHEIDHIRMAKTELLNGAELPLPGLSVDNGKLLLDGKAWDCMSGSEQLIVACAIVGKLNPNCRFVLMDKLEQLDLETLDEFDKWLVEHDLQCLATRVSTGSECTIVIQDGEVQSDEY